MSSLRVEASRKGFGNVILWGIGSAAMGHPLLETMLGDVPLATCMKHFIAAHAAAMDASLLETCQRQQAAWAQHEGELRAKRNEYNSAARFSGAPLRPLDTACKS